jgi:DNA excision repair protein ERCC-4
MVQEVELGKDVQVTLTPADLIIDTREASKHPSLVTWLERRGLSVSRQLLDVGDYVLNAVPMKRRLCIERKTPTDFLGGLVKQEERGSGRGRFWDQLNLLSQIRDEKTDVAIALIGWLGMIEKISKWSSVSICRIFDEVTLTWRIPIIPFANQLWFQNWLFAKCKDLGKTEEKQILPLRARRRDLPLEEAPLFLLEGLVGPQTAIALLNRFGTVRAIANATLEELMAVDGVGKIRGHLIHSTFNYQWSPRSVDVERG